MKYVKVIFENISEEVSEMIIAMLDDTQPIGAEYTQPSLWVYYDAASYVDQELQTIAGNLGYSYSTIEVEEENWNALWESNFQPVILDYRLAIRAHFHETIPEVEQEIVITPKMSFGTGHHATTKMMLDYILNQNVTGKRVFDFGTGTGVLGIVAAKRGAAYVLATDNDTWCIENAKENSLHNEVNLDIQLLELPELNQTFDLILANINLNVLLATMSSLKKLLAPGGQILLSGILVEDKKTMEGCLHELQLQSISNQEMNAWMAMQVTRQIT
jgi:ribosomal protein L11 methyltransferase